MLGIVIFVCALLIGCNAFYNTEDNEERYEISSQNLKKINESLIYTVII
ncbi:hypothetical protein [Clostridium beijerinckii]|nr:hypothetical protein [Clostridium beijerinckii]NRU22159.1 hypothetical protein [Clostridium beijerinckii]NRW45291.1 hypothetical protein [Clostridium beijerinckii]NSA04962.1 hypothetical protein [Clostridium beijerinckii]